MSNPMVGSPVTVGIIGDRTTGDNRRPNSRGDLVSGALPLNGDNLTKNARNCGRISSRITLCDVSNKRMRGNEEERVVPMG